MLLKHKFYDCKCRLLAPQKPDVKRTAVLVSYMEASQLAVLVVSKFIKNFVPGSSTNYDSVKITRVSFPESRYP